MSKNDPRVSIGMPVYNGERTLCEALDTLLNQPFQDFEIVISDNASDDLTEAICREYARRDARVRYYRNADNMGLIANFNRVFQLSRGEYFRWIGCDDRLSSEYLERMVQALDSNPESVLATCYQRHYDDARNCFYEEFTGGRVDSALPHRRFARILWFFRASRYYLDPIYSLIRRSVLLETGLLRFMLGTDLVLTSELALAGPFCHVSECLAFRRITPDTPRKELLRRCDPNQSSVRWWFVKMCATMASIVLGSSMTRALKARCLLSLAGFFVSKTMRGLYYRTRRLGGTVTGYRALRAYLRDKGRDRRVPCRGGAERT